MFHRKYRTIFFPIVLGLFLSHIPVITDLVNLSILSTDNALLSSEVWSDDFENATKTLSEWAIDGFYFDDEFPDTRNVTLSDGLLYSNGTGVNILTHNSTTAIGTWSLDVFLEDSDFTRIVIVFMSPHWEDYINSLEGYAFSVYSYGATHNFGLGYYVQDMAGAYIEAIDIVPFNRLSGWLHIDITRQSDSNLYVYLNGTLTLHGIDTHVSSSEFFRLTTYTYSIFDNITISDTIDIDRVPPRWTEPLINHIINEGDDFRYALHADDYAGIDTWWVSDIANFEVDDEGVISSVAPLPDGNYSVEVYVNDTFGNVLSGAFNVEVLPLPTNTTASTGPSSLDPYVITLYGAAGVAWVVAVTFIIRDYRKRKNALG